MADEFTRLIQAQRGYQMNSKVVQAWDDIQRMANELQRRLMKLATTSTLVACRSSRTHGCLPILHSHSKEIGTDTTMTSIDRISRAGRGPPVRPEHRRQPARRPQPPPCSQPGKAHHRSHAQSTDSVTLSDSARSVATARSAVQNSPDVREQKVADIKQQLSDGTYQVSSPRPRPQDAGRVQLETRTGIA